MIASIDRDGRVTVTGTVGEWRLLLERLDAKRLENQDDTSNAREILIAASVVPLNGGVSKRTG